MLAFEDSDHNNYLLEKLNTLRKNRQFCDVILQVGTPQDVHEIYAHRAILASASRYFLDIFTNDSIVAACGIPQIQLYKLLSTNYEVDAFNYLLDFIYTSRLEVPQKRVRNVYALANRLKMTTVAQKCGEYLASTLTPDTCLSVRSTPGVLHDPILLNSVDNYIKNNIVHVMKSKYVEQLNKIKIDVLQNSDEEIELINPRHLFNMISDWMKREFDEKRLSFDQLMLKTYMLYLNNADHSLHDCLEIENDDYNYSELVHEYKSLSRKLSVTKKSIENISNSANAKQINENNKSLCQSENVSSITDLLQSNGKNNLNGNLDDNHPTMTYNVHKSNNKNTMPSKPRQFLFTRSDSDSSLSSITDDDENDWKLLATDNSSKNHIIGLAMIAGKLCILSVKLKVHTAHNIRNNSLEKPEIFSSIAPMHSVRCALGSACLQQKLVVCGGYDRSECLKTVEIYDITTNKWTSLEPMNVSRGRFSITVLNDKIYAIGGSDGQKELSSGECYDSKIGRWKFISNCPVFRSNGGVCNLNGKIFVIGGWNGQRGLQRCDVYDPQTNEWSRIADLHVGRYQVAVATLNGEVYAVGGCDTWTCLHSVEKYIPELNQWQLIANMALPRRGCGVAAYRDKLYVVGGHDGIYSLCSTEIFDPKTESWAKGPSMTICRANVAVAVVNDILYAIGGFSGKSFLNTVEYLDFKNNEWTTFLKNKSYEDASKNEKQSDNYDVKDILNDSIKMKELDNMDMNVNDTNAKILETKFSTNKGKNEDNSRLGPNEFKNSRSKSKEPLIEVEEENPEN